MTKLVKLITSLGNIVLELDDKQAPVTVANFLQYVTSDRYDGTIFHRVIRNFMVQGGGFAPGLKQNTTFDPIKNEAKNGLKNEKYTVAMARTSDPHSATGQFFINTTNNGFLDYSQAQDGWGYAVFGKVIEGQDVVDKMNDVKTGRKGFHDDVPIDDVVLLTAEEIERQILTKSDVGDLTSLLGGVDQLAG
jgi:peptidyl-prolyl cis-trans isomerase B (cyclophilin B)